MRPRLPARLLSAALTLGALAGATSLHAQELRYTTASQVQLGGALGAMMGAFSDVDEPTLETVYVSDGVVRTDRDGTSTILRMGEGSMIQIDHEDRTWYRFDFGDFAGMAQGMRADAHAPQAAQPSEEAPEVTGDFSVDRTGRTQNVNGYGAEQVLMTLEIEARADERGEQAAEPGQVPPGARMVFFTEMWMSEELAAHPALQRVGDEAMGFVQGQGGSSMAGISAAMTQDPRMGEALERFQEEMADLRGMAVRTTSLFLVLPPDQEFDREAAIRALEEDPTGEGPDLAGAAGEGAAAAARRALGRFGGFGGGDDEPEEPPAPTQQTILRMVQEVRDIEATSLDPSLFQPPTDYREVQSPLSGRGNGPGR